MKTQPTSQSRAVINYYLSKVNRYKHLRNGALISVPVTVLINSYLPALIAAEVLSRLSKHDYVQNTWHSFGWLLLAYFVFTALEYSCLESRRLLHVAPGIKRPARHSSGGL